MHCDGHLGRAGGHRRMHSNGQTHARLAGSIMSWMGDMIVATGTGRGASSERDAQLMGLEGRDGDGRQMEWRVWRTERWSWHASRGLDSASWPSPRFPPPHIFLRLGLSSVHSPDRNPPSTRIYRQQRAGADFVVRTPAARGRQGEPDLGSAVCRPKLQRSRRPR